jgi:hypothetical protein
MPNGLAIYNCSTSLCFDPKGRGSASAMDTGEGWGHDGAPWTLRPNPSTPRAPVVRGTVVLVVGPPRQAGD